MIDSYEVISKTSPDIKKEKEVINLPSIQTISKNIDLRNPIINNQDRKLDISNTLNNKSPSENQIFKFQINNQGLKNFEINKEVNILNKKHHFKTSNLLDLNSKNDLTLSFLLNKNQNKCKDLELTKIYDVRKITDNRFSFYDPLLKSSYNDRSFHSLEQNNCDDFQKKKVNLETTNTNKNIKQKNQISNDSHTKKKKTNFNENNSVTKNNEIENVNQSNINIYNKKDFFLNQKNFFNFDSLFKISNDSDVFQKLKLKSESNNLKNYDTKKVLKLSNDNNNEYDIISNDHNNNNLVINEIKKLFKNSFLQRVYLGSIIYNSTTTWSNLQISHLHGLKSEHRKRFIEIKYAFEERLKDHNQQKKYIPIIPPLDNVYINSLIEIKIPFRHIFKFKTEFHTIIEKKREVWGGLNGIYTDDSDILCILSHLGFFNNSINLTQWNNEWSKEDIIIPLNSTAKNCINSVFKNKVDQIHGDLSVEILLLPKLSSYYGFYANGINSRSWTGSNKHSGLSIAVYNIKWQNINSYLMEKQFVQMYRKELLNDIKIEKNSSNEG